MIKMSQIDFQRWKWNVITSNTLNNPWICHLDTIVVFGFPSETFLVLISTKLQKTVLLIIAFIHNNYKMLWLSMSNNFSNYSEYYNVPAV